MPTRLGSRGPPTISVTPRRKTRRRKRRTCLPATGTAGGVGQPPAMGGLETSFRHQICKTEASQQAVGAEEVRGGISANCEEKWVASPLR